MAAVFGYIQHFPVLISKSIVIMDGYCFSVSISAAKKNRGQKWLFFAPFLPRFLQEGHRVLWFILTFLPYFCKGSSESRLPHALFFPNLNCIL